MVCVKSFVPKLKNSACLAISLALIAALGNSIIVPTKNSIFILFSSWTFFAILITKSFIILISASVETSGIIISGKALLCLLFLRSIKASKIALHCISYISGKDIPNLQPLWPNIGFCSWSSSILDSTSLISVPTTLATSEISFSDLGKNSCKGGSSNRTVTGRPCIILNISMKSFLWWGRSFCRALDLSSWVLDKIISLTDKILSSSKNMCSVLQRPIPSAPKSLAVWVSKGVSEFVLTFNFLILSAHSISFEKSPEISGFIVGTFPKIILPEEPSIVITSPSLTSVDCVLKIFCS